MFPLPTMCVGENAISFFGLHIAYSFFSITMIAFILSFCCARFVESSLVALGFLAFAAASAMQGWPLFNLLLLLLSARNKDSYLSVCEIMMSTNNKDDAKAILAILKRHDEDLIAHALSATKEFNEIDFSCFNGVIHQEFEQPDDTQILVRVAALWSRSKF